jgi:hypothetical protein
VRAWGTQRHAYASHFASRFRRLWGGGGCSLVQFINGGETAVEVNIIANCFVDGSANEVDCTGTVGYDVRGFKTTVVKNNKADYIYMCVRAALDIAACLC